MKVDVKVSVLNWDCESEDEDENENSYIRPDIGWLFFAALFPQEDKGSRAAQSECKTAKSHCFAAYPGDHEEAERIGYDLRNSNHQAIDEDVEVELVQHQSRGVKLEDNRALDQNEHQSHHI